MVAKTALRQQSAIAGKRLSTWPGAIAACRSVSASLNHTSHTTSALAALDVSTHPSGRNARRRLSSSSRLKTRLARWIVVRPLPCRRRIASATSTATSYDGMIYVVDGRAPDLKSRGSPLTDSRQHSGGSLTPCPPTFLHRPRVFSSDTYNLLIPVTCIINSKFPTCYAELYALQTRRKETRRKWTSRRGPPVSLRTSQPRRRTPWLSKGSTQTSPPRCARVGWAEARVRDGRPFCLAL